ncbi:MAG TPA: phenylalanine--tRNA ligase beta subunit-related protein [Thermoanaerobaculia bacterium]|nr:phenylalanine--tRNA ligase beta subunit-related protein [Thermoanaerobaculia bacterium]
MRNVTMAIDAAVCRQFPELVCGAFIVEGLSGINTGQFLIDAEALKARLAAEGVTEETVLAHPIIAGWRLAIQTLGLKAAKFRSSAEQLVRRATRGDEIKAPGDLVRFYCQLSASHIAPLGAYDVRALPSTDIVVRFARPADNFQPLGGMNGDMSLHDSIVVYAADNDVICWAFNVRDDRRTALTEMTSTALFTTEAAFSEQRAASCRAITELRESLLRAGAIAGPILWTTGDAVTLG